MSLADVLKPAILSDVRGVSAMSRYPVPASRHRVEEVIQRSRFISTAAPVEDVAAARAFIEEMRSEFADASHNCYAFLAGPPGSTAQMGMTDDGEPSGTAGRPMLAVLMGSGVGDIAVVVTRYFGGIKLGTGGLVRAYGGGVKSVLESLPTRQKIAWETVRARGPYRWVTPVARLLPDYEATISDQTYDDLVSWVIAVPEERKSDLTATLIEMTHGEMEVRQ
jgi:uncharacterized YigZ family protein